MQFTANGMSGKVVYARKNAEEASEQKYELRRWKKHMVVRVKENVHCVYLVTSTSVQVSYQLFDPILSEVFHSQYLCLAGMPCI